MPRSAAFINGFAAAELYFYTNEGEVTSFPNPFPVGSDEHAGYEEAVYVFTQK